MKSGSRSTLKSWKDLKPLISTRVSTSATVREDAAEASRWAALVILSWSVPALASVIVLIRRP